MTQRELKSRDYDLTEEISYGIKNIVAKISVDITEKIDLVQILSKVPNSKYNPEIFPGLILKIEDPKATFLIFSSGKMILTGLNHPTFLKNAVNKMLKTVKTAGIILKNPKYEVVNLVASGDLQLFIDLNKATLLMEKAMYEPEVFPALIYRMQDPNAVFLLFSNGKFICTKILDEENLKNAIKKLEHRLRELDLIITDYDSIENTNIFL